MREAVDAAARHILRGNSVRVAAGTVCCDVVSLRALRKFGGNLSSSATGVAARQPSSKWLSSEPTRRAAQPQAASRGTASPNVHHPRHFPPPPLLFPTRSKGLLRDPVIGGGKSAAER